MNLNQEKDFKQLLECSIYAIDDEPVITEMTAFVLKDFGFKNIHCFNDSVEAFETMRFIRPDLIITDVTMPEMSGTCLTRLTRKMETTRDVPVIVLTADTSDETSKKLASNGAYCVMLKPFDDSELIVNVSEALAEAKSREKFEQRIDGFQRMYKQVQNEKILDQENSLRKAAGR